MPGSGGTSNLSMSHFIGVGLTLRSRLRHHRPKGQHANSRAFNSLVIWRRDGARLASGLGLGRAKTPSPEGGEKPGPVRSQATIAAISGLVPTMFMTRVRL